MLNVAGGILIVLFGLPTAFVVLCCGMAAVGNIIRGVK